MVFADNLHREDQLPLLTSPRRRVSNSTRRRSFKPLVFALLLVSVGMCVFFYRTTQLLLETETETNHVDAVPVKLSIAVTASASGVANVTANETIPIFDPAVDGDINAFACVGWRQTKTCSPDGPREPENDRACNIHVHKGSSGYCEIQNMATGQLRRVLPTHCTSLYRSSSFACDSFKEMLQYGAKAVRYTHDPVFSFTKNQEDLLASNGLTNAPSPTFFTKGISMVIYEKLLLGAYVSIRSLREELNSTLPVEMWYRRTETDPNHPLLQILKAQYGVYLREITNPLATGFYTKLHAVFYSAFDNVMLLDADNYAVRDPAYLFDTPEYTTTGAMFWPDFWHPGHTLFNVHEKSLVWQVFDLPFVDMFEQESGQVLINRRRHFTALNALMYYGFSLPRIHDNMRLIWGDKDLFRFAWLKTNSSFHMIARPPGSAGKLNRVNDNFCGLTMVQHDPQGEIVFLHRNMQKIRADTRERIWSHVQQFKREAPLSAYRITWAKVFEAYPSCWAQATKWDELFTFTSIFDLFGGFESTLLRFADEGVDAMNVTSTASATPSRPPTLAVNKVGAQRLP